MTFPAEGFLLAYDGTCYQPVGVGAADQALVSDTAYLGGVKWTDISNITCESSPPPLSYANTAWDANNKAANILLADSDMTATRTDSSNQGVVTANSTQTAGKWYWECTVISPSQDRHHCGFAKTAVDITKYLGETADGFMYYGFEGVTYNNATSAAYGDTYGPGATISVALDLDNGAAYFAKNGVWQNSGDPESGATKTGAAFTWTPAAEEYYPAVSDQYSGNGFTANFGNSAFTHTVPTGYNPGWAS